MGNLNPACWWPNCECQTEKGDPCKYEDPGFYIRKAGERKMTEKKPTAEETIAQAEAEERQRMNDTLRVQQFFHDVGTELNRAREKFPSAFACGLATMEEAGELAQALLKHAAGKWPQRRIYEEAIQVAVMAMRCALEGDASLGGHQYTEPGE